jgi:hypothetical protein
MNEELLTDLISGTLTDCDHDLPHYVISGSGEGWFLNPETHQMVMISRGTEIVPMPGDADDRDRLLVRAPFRFLLIHKDEVQEIGWN